LEAGEGCCNHAEMACNCSDVNSPTPGIVKRCGKPADEFLDGSGKMEFGEREAVGNTPSKMAGET